MKIFHTTVSSFRRMPEGLRITSLGLIVLTFCLPFAIPSIGLHFVNGDRASFVEFLHRGGSALFLVIGSLSASLFYGFVMARHWSRHLAVVSGWAIVVGHFIGWQRINLATIFAFLTFGCLPVWYFYFCQPVRAYFKAIRENRIA